jgi:aspartate/tyrosine/aromatic aminotransferase
MANFIPKIEYEHPTLGTQTITFELPPEGDFRSERQRTVARETTSGAGVVQSKFQYIEQTRRLKLVFISSAIEAQFRQFFEDYASRGANEFKYFESNDEVDFETCILVKPTYAPKILFREGNDFVYEFNLNFRVLS